MLLKQKLYFCTYILVKVVSFKYYAKASSSALKHQYNHCCFAFVVGLVSVVVTKSGVKPTGVSGCWL